MKVLIPIFAVMTAVALGCAKKLRSVDSPEQAIVAAEAYLHRKGGSEAVRAGRPLTAMWGREVQHWLVSGPGGLLILVAKNGHAGEMVPNQMTELKQ